TLSELTARLNADPADLPSDAELLARFSRGAEGAFEELVRRHADLVYSTAARLVRDSQTASEVTNAVFMVLARKARPMGPSAIVPAWLHRTTRYVSLRTIRARIRRQRYELEAACMQETMNQPEAVDGRWAEVAPLLDEAIAELGARDHEALVLRFFEQKSFREIAF